MSLNDNNISCIIIFTSAYWGLCKLSFCFHSKEYILVKLRGNTAKTSPEYTPGDHIAVFPENSNDDVELLCERVTLPDVVNVDTIIRLLTSKASHVPGLSFTPQFYYILLLCCFQLRTDLQDFEVKMFISFQHFSTQTIHHLRAHVHKSPERKVQICKLGT